MSFNISANNNICQSARMAGNPNGQATTTTTGTHQLNNKDLIIRMLAEVFQVNQLEDGQVRWQQVSSSLVPVSLYSRTTSKWLNYLLAASSMATNNATTSTMSPDSRDFLLYLLHQFHQQQANAGAHHHHHGHNSSMLPNQWSTNSNATSGQDYIVFQVVGHDFLDGKCKRILNVKIAQPGTRLGQASDYFVYWKEPANSNLMGACPSSNTATPAAQHRSGRRARDQFNQGGANLSSSLSHDRWILQSNSTGSCLMEPQTWGLNFASTNDARLFYDICSLNLVDIDLNSDYLRHLASAAAANATSAAPIDDQWTTVSRPLSNLNRYKQQQQHQHYNYQASYNQATNQQCDMCSRFDTSRSSAPRPSGCVACGVAGSQKQTTTYQRRQRLNDLDDSLDSRGCAIHRKQRQEQQATRGTGARRQAPGTMRSRSRSTTRPQTTGSSRSGSTTGERRMKRLRSLSTPASPVSGLTCPVHSGQSTYQVDEQEEDYNSHHPRCMSYARRKRSELLNKQSTDSENNLMQKHQQQQQQQQQYQVRPQKPARGLLRDSLREVGVQKVNSSGSGQSHGHPFPLPPPVPAHQTSSSAGKRRTAKTLLEERGTTKRSTGDTSGQTSSSMMRDQVTRDPLDCRPMLQQNGNELLLANSPLKRPNEDDGELANLDIELDGVGGVGGNENGTCVGQQAEQIDQQVARQFVASRASQRRSTGLDLRTSATLLQRAYVDGGYDHHQDEDECHQAEDFDSQDETMLMMTQFNTLSRKDARLARARYANSKNMKEFLSLDAGNLQLNNNNHNGQLFANLERPIQRQQQQQPQDAFLVQTNMEPETSEHQSSGKAELDYRVNLLHNVATTTEDLPLDPATYRRMYKLTSDEIISERTEPKSLSGSESQRANLMDTSGRIQVNHTLDEESHSAGSRSQNQARALSLGRELRGRNARSDVGRRRSLERSAGVDLDPTLPAASARRLSPLIQAASPATQATSAKSSPSGQSQQLGANQRRTGTQRMLSFKSAPDFGELVAGNALEEQADLQQRQQQQQARQANRTADQQQQLLLRPSHQTRQNQQMLSSYAVPLCSNEEAEDEQARHRYHFGRQYHSCPNSLRRKNNHNYTSSRQDNLNLAIDPFYVPLACPCCRQQVGGAANDNDNGIASALATDNGSALCRRPSPRDFCSLCAIQGSQCCGKSCIQQAAHFHCNTRGYSTSNNSLPLRISRQQSASSTANSSNHHRQISGHCLLHSMGGSELRPCSSLSSRSPLHYGLYESEGEELLPAEVAPCAVGGQQQQQQQQQTCCIKQQHQQQQQQLPSFDPSPGAVHFRPVQGYDQTLARASTLKSRQRAKSQPPGLWPNTRDANGDSNNNSSPKQADNELPLAGQTVPDTFHLSKSMENVQKLIREVQFELNALRRRPFAGFQCIGAAFVDQPLPQQQQQQQQRLQQQQQRSRANKIPKGEGPQTGGDRTGANELATTLAARESFAQMSQDENGKWREHHIGNTKAATTAAATTTTMEQQNVIATQRLGSGSSSATRPAGQFKCVGAIRKAGFLSVKKWILKRRQSIELARKQGWKRYWVCLRGTALLFHSVIEEDGDGNNDEYKNEEQLNGGVDNSKRIDLLSWLQSNCAGQVESVAQLLRSEQDSRQKIDNSEGNKLSAYEDFLHGMLNCYIEREPRHLIIIESAIAQPIPEHPRRDFVFCLSTSFGDAYLFQSGCQLESENWIAAIHNACAASIARDLTRDEAIKLLETKVRKLELEAEKKMFLRQRLESRITSMSSIGAAATLVASADLSNVSGHQQASSYNREGRVTMRSLLYRLSQQLLTLDAYIEQMHCEIYQLRCYLSSCGAQQLFYQQQQHRNNATSVTATMAIDLPHPKSLLMHVSKATKLLLIKLGVFTVSSFHAYTHARQESANSILQNIQQVSQQQQQQQRQFVTGLNDQQTGNSRPSLELRVRSHSLSESFLRRSEETNSAIENDSEKLIEMSDIRSVGIRIARQLYLQIKRSPGDVLNGVKQSLSNDETSEDRYSINDNEGEDSILVNMKLHSNSDQATIIKQLLQFIEPNCGEFQYLNYYLRFKLSEEAGRDAESISERPNEQLQYVAKRRETLKDWDSFGNQLELVEKIIFKIELTRQKINEGSAPFGLSVEAQLISSELDSQLNVFCGYIEWGSVADKAGLHDDDEFLMINGVPVKDLDMMFVESLIQEGSKLRLIVRSSRLDCPSGAILLDSVSWRPAKDDGLEDNEQERDENLAPGSGRGGEEKLSGSQLISDEYISSLVCPPPPSRSSAFLREEPSLLRQKSDLGEQKSSMGRSGLDEDDGAFISRPAYLKANSQHGLDLADASDMSSPVCNYIYDIETGKRQLVDGTELANQLLRKTEQLSKLIDSDNQRIGSSRLTLPAMDVANSDINSDLSISNPTTTTTSKTETQQLDQNSVERLRKSVLELLETEYAFIKHLETINEHYMNPLSEMSFLNIAQLRVLNQVLLELLSFQRRFFAQLMRSVLAVCDIQNPSRANDESRDELEDLNTIVLKLESFNSLLDFKLILRAIANIFDDEAHNFKQYVSYCVAYSKLQKILHTKRSLRGNNLSSSSISLMPSALNTFQSSSGGSQSFVATTTARATNFAGSQTGSGQYHRDFLRPLGSLMQTAKSNQEQDAQLRSLAEFLANLDSSSSSVSLSLPKSSGSEQTQPQNVAKIQSSNNNNSAIQHHSSLQTFHKSAHQQNFESYLIKPIQRIVKYPMLLNSIAASVNQLDSQDDTIVDLHNAVKRMESAVSHVNEAQCLHDEYGAIFDQIEGQYLSQQAEISAKISATPSPLVGAHQPAIDLSIGQLLYFNSVEWLNTNEFAPKLKKATNLTQLLFVFNSCVVFICKEQMSRSSKRKGLPNSGSNSFSQITNLASISTSASPANKPSKQSPLDADCFSTNNNANSIIRYQCLIPVSEVQVRSVPNQSIPRNGNGNGVAAQTAQPEVFKWELFQCSSSNSNSSLLSKSSKRTNTTGGKVFVLASRSNEDRNLFLRKIRSIIRDSVRNMSLRLTRSPSIKSMSTNTGTNKKFSSPSSGTNTNNSSCSHSTSLSPVHNSGVDTNNEHFIVECKYTTRRVAPTTTCTSSFKAGIQVNN